MTLHDLPTEILYQILLSVPPASIPTLQQVCRKFNDLSQPLLWRHHCQSNFQHWRPEHEIHAKYAQSAAQVNWKQLFRTRHLGDRAVSQELESILASQTGRIEKAENILAYGYDAKDTLLRHLDVGDDAEDVLARRYAIEYTSILGGEYEKLSFGCRYYSDAVLGAVHRTRAIEEWIKLREGQPVSLEQALAAFDQFVLHDRDGDLEEVRTADSKFLELFLNGFLILSRLVQAWTMSPSQSASRTQKYLKHRPKRRHNSSQGTF